MKAIGLLKWLIKEGIDTGAMGVVQVDDEFDFKAYFGYAPDVQVPVGEYAYLYSDCVYDADMEQLAKYTGTDEQPYVIITEEPDRENGGQMIIYLLKLED